MTDVHHLFNPVIAPPLVATKTGEANIFHSTISSQSLLHNPFSTILSFFTMPLECQELSVEKFHLIVLLCAQ